MISDTVCPWCYIGKRRLENAIAQFPVRLPASWVLALLWQQALTCQLLACRTTSSW